MPVAPLLILIPLLMASCAAPGRTLAPDMMMAADEKPADAPAGAEEPWVIRHAFLDLNERAFHADGFAPGDTLRARLFQGEEVALRMVARDSVASRATLRADLLPPEEGVLLLALEPDRAAGTLDWTSRRTTLHVRFDSASGRHVLLEVDPDLENILPGAPPEVPPEP